LVNGIDAERLSSDCRLLGCHGELSTVHN
jgi:hypothetical protein